jgi:hypothetical protein
VRVATIGLGPPTAVQRILTPEDGMPKFIFDHE